MRAYFAMMVVGLWCTACGGGPTSIAGRVVDHTGTPVQKAEIVTEPETDVVVTNTRGFFVLSKRINEVGESEPIPPGKYAIKVRKFGFQDLAIEVSVEGGKQKVDDLVMQPRTPDIGEMAPDVTDERETQPDEGSTPKTGI